MIEYRMTSGKSCVADSYAMNPQDTDEHHIKQSKHHLKNFKVALKCTEAISEFTIIDQADRFTIGCQNQEKKVIKKITIEAPKHKKSSLKSKGMESAKKTIEGVYPGPAEYGVCSKPEKAVQKRKHTKLEEHMSVRKQKKKPDIRLKNSEILPNPQDPEPIHTEDQNPHIDGPQNEPCYSKIVKESVSGSVLHSLQSFCRQINPFTKTGNSPTNSNSNALQPEVEEKCNNSSDYQDAEDHLNSSPSVAVSNAGIDEAENCVENQELLPVISKSTTKEHNSSVADVHSSFKAQEVGVSDPSVFQSTSNHTDSLTFEPRLSSLCGKSKSQEYSSMEVNTEKFKFTKGVPFISLLPPKPSEFGLKHCSGSVYNVPCYTVPLAVHTKAIPSKCSLSSDASSSSSAVTVMPALSRLVPPISHSIPRRDSSTSRHFRSFSASSSSRGNKPKKRLRCLNMKRARKPKPYRKSQSKYKIHPVKPKSKNEIPYMVHRFLKSSEVSRRVDETPKPKSFSWHQYRGFMRTPSVRGLEFSKDPLQYHTPDVISSQQLLSYASYPVPSHLIGFKNFGNTCYMNATLQALTGLTKFCDGISTLQTEPGMVNYLKQLLTVHQEGNEPTSALKAFREYFITEVFPQFDNSNQQDASEFLITLINQGIKETNLFHDFFQFKYIEEIKCKKCVKVTCSTVQEDVMLNLMIPKQEFGIGSVQALMRNQMTTCQICKSESASCIFKFITLPRVLVLVMQRYCHTRTDGNDSRQVLKKIKTPFNLSHTLQVQHLVQSPEIFCSQTASIAGLQNINMESKSQPLIREFEASHVLQYYHLSAVVCHIGDGTNVGHYLADVYRPNMDGWYHYNDEAVSCTTFDRTELKENCYLLFYSLNK
ncbi:hypothetical protein B566_EDAN010625 [Ephemera danica]|nr:hypothetical protein B566_EDAN010625 [Ephemera danica]